MCAFMEQKIEKEVKNMLSTPDPIAFEIFGREIRWYAVLISAAVLLGLFLCVRRGKRVGIPEDWMYDVFLVCVPLAVLGARAYYVAFEWDYYAAHPSEIIAIWKGGLAIHGGIIMGIVGVWLVCRRHKMKLTTILDIMTPPLVLGQAIGRWGNYFNGEAYGPETTLPWAITVYDAAKGYIQVHPTFLYESLCDLAVFLILLLIIDRYKKFEGQDFFTYMILYSIGRFFIEGMRTDSLYLGSLRIAQLVSLLMIAIGIIGYIVNLQRLKKAESAAALEEVGEDENEQ